MNMSVQTDPVRRSGDPMLGNDGRYELGWCDVERWVFYGDSIRYDLGLQRA